MGIYDSSDRLGQQSLRQEGEEGVLAHFPNLLNFSAVNPEARKTLAKACVVSSSEI